MENNIFTTGQNGGGGEIRPQPPSFAFNGTCVHDWFGDYLKLRIYDF